MKCKRKDFIIFHLNLIMNVEKYEVTFHMVSIVCLLGIQVEVKLEDVHCFIWILFFFISINIDTLGQY